MRDESVCYEFSEFRDSTTRLNRNTVLIELLIAHFLIKPAKSNQHLNNTTQFAPFNILEHHINKHSMFKAHNTYTGMASDSLKLSLLNIATNEIIYIKF